MPPRDTEKKTPPKPDRNRKLRTFSPCDFVNTVASTTCGHRKQLRDKDPFLALRAFTMTSR